MAETALTWGESNWIWSNNPYTWGEINLVEKVEAGKSSDYKKTLTKEEITKTSANCFPLWDPYWTPIGPGLDPYWTHGQELQRRLCL